jgi:hypothetical protein
LAAASGDGHVVRRLLVATAALVALFIPGAAAVPRVPPFEHVVVVVFENKEEATVIGSRAAPTFNALARGYARLTRYYGIAHPSLPNYLALVSGSTQGIRTDCVDCMVDAPNLADSLDRAGKTWKVYAEGLPSPGFTGGFAGRYAKKHDPFLYFRNVAENPARAQRVVPFTELSVDLGAFALPSFALVIPDLCNSMHDCPVRTGDLWLHRMIQPLLRQPRTAIFITFDEGSSSARGGGHIPTLALGTAVRRRSRFTLVTSHYGLLRTIETAWGLPLLGRSAQARPITGIWK